jgi:hypothetical protein
MWARNRWKIDSARGLGRASAQCSDRVMRVLASIAENSISVNRVVEIMEKYVKA